MSNEITIQCGSSAHLIRFTSRDWKLLHGPFVKSGTTLSTLLSFSSVEPISVQRSRLLNAAEEVLESISASSELLEYDYTYDFSGHGINPPHGGSGTFCGFKIDGRDKCIVSEPGHCHICEFVGGGRSNYHDLRNRVPVETDDWGTITVRRRRKGLSWLSELPALVDFLTQVPDEAVSVCNSHR